MKKPNVIVFFTDQQRWDTCGIHGCPLGLTPNLDMHAQNNTDVHRFFTCQPVCGPARAALQTGLYPTQNGTYTNGRPLPKDSVTLAHLFNDAGYRTGYIGKWHLAGGEGPVEEADRGGYRDWLASNTLEFTSDAYHTRLYDNDNNPADLPGYRVDAVTDAAIRYIDRSKDEPFFLFISYIEPHFQNHLDSYPAPDGYEKRYGGHWTPPDLCALRGSSAGHLSGYFSMIKRLDEAYGRLHDALKSLSLEQNTVVLFTSDHACHFKTRNDEYKRSGHESSIRVPCVITGPGFKGGGKIHNLVSLIDLAPTLLDAAGIEQPAHMPGKSVKSLIGGKNEAWRDDVYVQISESCTARAIRTSRWKYIVSAGNDTGDAPWSDRYYETELYDLYADPYELNNLMGLDSHAKVLEKMRERLLNRIRETGEPVPEIVKTPFRPGGQKRVDDAEAVL